MSNNDSLTEVPAKKILEACDAYLLAKTNRINERREKLITEKMNKRRLFRPKMNREEAIQSLEKEAKDNYFHEWTALEEYWAGLNPIVRDLRKLALIAGDGTILLSRSDANLIYDFYI